MLYTDFAESGKTRIKLWHSLNRNGNRRPRQKPSSASTRVPRPGWPSAISWMTGGAPRSNTGLNWSLHQFPQHLLPNYSGGPLSALQWWNGSAGKISCHFLSGRVRQATGYRNPGSSIRDGSCVPGNWPQHQRRSRCAISSEETACSIAPKHKASELSCRDDSANLMWKPSAQ